MSAPKDPLLRQLALLQLLPRYPNSISTPELQRKLRADGYDIDLRSVQRDLNKLSGPLQLISDERARPYRWSLTADSPFNPSSLDTPTALALKLAQRHLEMLLPYGVLEQLRPHFRNANRHLDGLQKNGLAHWARRVRAIPNGKALRPAEVKQAVWSLVSSALIERKQLLVDYQSRSKGDIRSLRIHPAGIVFRFSITYLIGTVNQYPDLRQFALHRIRNAKLLKEPAKEQPDFDIDQYIASGAFSGRQTESEVDLVADVHPQIAWLLNETPLSAKQTLHPLPTSDWQRLRARIPDDQETLWWVFGLGDYILIHEPAAWVEFIRARLCKMLDQYGLSITPGMTQQSVKQHAPIQ